MIAKLKRFTAFLLTPALLLPGFGGASFAADASGDGEIVLESNGVTGVTLRTAAGSLPEGSVFTVSETQGDITDYVVNSFTGFAKSPQHIKMYSTSLTYDGKPVTPQYDVSVEFPIPEGWDTGTISAYREYESEYGQPMLEGSLGRIGAVDAAARILKTKATKDPDQLKADYLILDRGTPLDIAALALEDGLYAARITLGHKDNLDQMSMSNGALVGNTGYLEVADGVPTLFFETTSVQNAGATAYLSDLRVLEEPSGEAARTATKYAYHTNADGSLNVDDLANNPGVFYPKRVSLPLLAEVNADKSYMIRPIIPIMDIIAKSYPGSGGAEVYARLRIVDLAPAEGDNPLSGYEKSALRAKLEAAENLLQELPEEENSALGGALTAAWAVYNEDPGSARIEAEIEALSAAMGEAAAAPLPVIKTALHAKLAEAEAYKAKYYTEESFAALTAAIDAAWIVAEDEAATQAGVNAEIRALNAALAGLARNDAPIDQTELLARITEAADVTSGDYTKESWDALQTALAAARIVADDAAADQIAIDACAAALESAMAALSTELPAGLYEIPAYEVISGTNLTKIQSYATAFRGDAARVRFLGADMAVTLYPKSYQYEDRQGVLHDAWLTNASQAAKLPNVPVENVRDDAGHLIEAAYTIPFQKEPLYVIFDTTQEQLGGNYQVIGYLTRYENIWLDFDNAVPVEEDLADKLAAARAIGLGDYTDESYAALQAAIE
jgi:hypothetical protein